MCELSSLARNKRGAAISWGCAARPNGIACSISFHWSAARICSRRGVRMKPGATEFTRIRSRASSEAAHRAQAGHRAHEGDRAAARLPQGRRSDLQGQEGMAQDLVELFAPGRIVES